MYSKSEIVNAGKVLRENLTREAIPAIQEVRGLHIVEAFGIAHSWRDAHMLPLLRVRMELSRKLKHVEKDAVAAARLKRMASIRRKLQRPITLYQMQDIAGCRAILRSMKEVDRLVAVYRDGGSLHSIQSEDDYILRPKRDGYRSHHIILKFCGNGDEEIFNRQTVELQLRTRLQHAWATAVESVGLIRHENIKGGEGDANWRRFFELMSSELAYQEDRELAPTADLPREDVRREIRDLSKQIKAVSTLETYNRAINFTENYGQTYARYFLLQFDYDTREVYVQPFYNYEKGAARYVEEERTSQKRNTVLVEVNKVNDLKKAFPNYFLDVSAFTDKLKSVLSPGYKSSQAYDLSWLAAYR
ncbi:hypothetical protein EN932_01630 [Mesorhizobium sp. M7A.F.Ca.US.002.01.1.1]|uniref:RelA/SpoT domain-containing protein n=1 Tax=Mesorhizobium sp. M7A.F.Ca.US.002.01.1.1 TaxID=2496700 RepID=UPI000FD377E3|nr:RelA/SpoT domain-containing protein [Mesorhizobium sp. M7A.F.Ca.US.002.01.1.1]RVA15325.1 hypothetical protein EN932_01630 [Mesorhizobium sp. M7A.F.Ca.US.002.01.1.1]